MFGVTAFAGFKFCFYVVIFGQLSCANLMDGKTGLLKFFSHLPTPLAVLRDTDLVLEEANDAFVKLLGSHVSALQKPLPEIFPGIRASDLTGIKNTLIHDKAYEIEKLDVNTGTDYPVKNISLSFSVVYDDDRRRHIGVSACDITSTVRHEKILHDSDTRFETLINQAPMATAVYTGEDMRIRVANPTMLKLWGKDAGVIGKKLRDALPELEGQPFHDLLKNVYETGIAYHSDEDKVDLMIDGKLQTGYFNFTYEPLFDIHNRVYAILNMAVDVTSHVHDKQQLLNVQETTRLALESAELGTWVLYPQSNVVEWDERCKELYGFPKEDAIPYFDVLKHMHPADRDNVHAAVSKALDPASDGKYACEFRTIGANDKKVRWLRCKGKAYFDDKNQPYRFAGTAQDITHEVNQREEQGKLLMLIENSTDFVAISDLEGKVSYMNKAGREMIGVDTDEEIIGIDGKELYYQNIDYKLTNDLPLDYLEKGTWQKILDLKNFKTGQPVPCQVDYVLLRNPAGEITGRGATVRDLRPIIAAKKALEKSENLLRNITSEAPAALWMSDEVGQINYVNQTWIDWTGIPFHEQMGYGWTQAILEDDRKRALNKFLDDVKKRRPYEVDFRLKHVDGSVRWMIAKGNAQFNSEGVFIGYIGSNTDITQNIISEKKLQAINDQLNHQIRQFEFVTDVMPQMVWVTRADGYHEFYNQRWYDFTGRNYEETKNRGWADLLHPDDYERTWGVWNESLKTGKPYEIEYRMRRNDGEYRWLLARALPLLDDEGIILKWFGTCTDIHEQKLLERQKDDFLGIASHELKTPVTSIKAYAQVLESILRKKGDGKEAEMAAKMNGQINRLTNLIGDLLDVTKINSGRLQFNKTLFSFNDMVAEMIEELQRTTHHHTIIENFDGGSMVFGDRERIGQVITNMITNAIKYSPKADKIIVHTSVEDQQVVLCVEDFGVGIPSDKQEKVFEQFYRVSGDMQHTFPGLGLGLYISSEIVKREGGRIWVNSNEGQGSTFCFSLPLQSN